MSQPIFFVITVIRDGPVLIEITYEELVSLCLKMSHIQTVDSLSSTTSVTGPQGPPPENIQQILLAYKELADQVSGLQTVLTAQTQRMAILENKVKTVTLNHTTAGLFHNGKEHSLPCSNTDLTSAVCQTAGDFSVNHLISDAQLSRPGRRLNREANRVKDMLKPAVSKTIPKCILQDIYTNTVCVVDEERKRLLEFLTTYELEEGCNDQLCDNVEAVLEEAAAWTQGMRTVHRELGYHKESLSKQLYTDLSPYSSKSEINIFEFFRRFELITGDSGTPAEQAEVLYTKYLDKTLQLELVKKRHKYEAMRKYLVQKYGVLSVITDKILTIMAAESFPMPNASYFALANYFRVLNSVVQQVDDLRQQENFSHNDVEAHIYSEAFLAKLLQYIPPMAKNNFMEMFVKEDEDICRLEGERAFNLILVCTSKHFKKYDALSRLEDDSQQKPGSSSSKRKSAVLSVSGNSSPNNRVFKRRNHGSPRFVCPISQHNHALGECQEFLTLTASERAAEVLKAGVYTCRTCLGTSFGCHPSSCENLPDLPPILICYQCREIAKQKGWTPFNVLLCNIPSHERPDMEEITEALTYYKGFIPSGHMPVNLSAHINLVAPTGVDTTRNPKSLSSKANPSHTTPAINTATGRKVHVNDTKVKTEVPEDIVYVLQILNLKGYDVLTFYDRGSNQNMISGPLAEELELKVVTQEPAAIGVVGGGKILTEYGTYAVRLGPTETGHYHELTAQGLRRVTDTLPRYDLDQINTMVKETGVLQRDTTLPKYIGGSPAQLLIGLKDTELEPWCVLQLPNGLGVYKSALKDKFGSNYCYGGPDRLFTAVNKQTGGNVNHFRANLTQMVNQYRGSPFLMLSNAPMADVQDLHQIKPNASFTDYSKQPLGHKTTRNQNWHQKRIKREAKLKQLWMSDYQPYHLRKKRRKEKTDQRHFNEDQVPSQSLPNSEWDLQAPLTVLSVV